MDELLAQAIAMFELTPFTDEDTLNIAGDWLEDQGNQLLASLVRNGLVFVEPLVVYDGECISGKGEQDGNGYISQRGSGSGKGNGNGTGSGRGQGNGNGVGKGVYNKYIGRGRGYGNGTSNGCGGGKGRTHF